MTANPDRGMPLVRSPATSDSRSISSGDPGRWHANQLSQNASCTPGSAWCSSGGPPTVLPSACGATPHLLLMRATTCSLPLPGNGDIAERPRRCRAPRSRPDVPARAANGALDLARVSASSTVAALSRSTGYPSVSDRRRLCPPTRRPSRRLNVAQQAL